MLTFLFSRDLPFKDARDLKDVFTSFRNQVEPLREAPRKELPKPDQLLPLPDHIPSPAAPFQIPDTYNGVLEALHKPLPVDAGMPNMPLEMPEGAESAHPFKGGSKTGLQRIRHLIESGSMTTYKDTRNGLIGQDFSTKLSAWLALGSVTARQIHWLMVDFEDGKTDLGKTTSGYGKGENKGTAGVRFELLWRDYMRLCTKKFGTRLFMVDGYRRDGEHADDAAMAAATAGGVYHTGDVATRDDDGYITFVGRTDDVFKASDYRISPFELESVLIEHPAVAEAAIVPSPDPVRLAVPKAYVVLAAGHEPTAETARSILEFAKENLAPYKRIRRLEFAALPKTISGKIRRVELRGRERELHGDPAAAPDGEFTL